MRAQTNEVNYVQYGVVTDCISAVIEIGEDGSNKAAIGCDGDASDESPPHKMDKQEEIIITKRICIAPDTSDMITESMSKSCARSIASPTDDLASTQVPTSTQETKDRKGEKEDVDVVSVSYSVPLIEKMKTDVAITLTKMSRSCKSHESSISTPSQQKTRVQFAETIISEVRERPRIDPDVVRDLFYSISDIERFEDEAEESSYDSSSAGNSFSYTVTPTTSYDEGNDDTENGHGCLPALPHRSPVRHVGESKRKFLSKELRNEKNMFITTLFFNALNLYSPPKPMQNTTIITAKYSQHPLKHPPNTKKHI